MLARSRNFGGLPPTPILRDLRSRGWRIHHEARPVAVLRPASPELDKAFAAIAAEVPEEDWQRVPQDLAKNLDRYLYGTSKVAR